MRSSSSTAGASSSAAPTTSSSSRAVFTPTSTAFNSAATVRRRRYYRDVQLIIEPEGGIGPILDAIDSAKTDIDILIFRLDCRSVTKGLEGAVRRGVAVRAMIAKKHRGGSRDLRKLERRLLKA